MKDSILKLRSEGKSFREIVSLLGCSSATVSYHCSKDGKKKKFKQNAQIRSTRMKRIKILFGGKCSICGYCKCLDALQFHHKNKENKRKNISKLTHSWSQMLQEAEKCILICANCHFELHGVLTR